MDGSRWSNDYGQCRCCLAKGYHRNIMKEYYTGDLREVYYDMFMECYNVFLSSNTSLSPLICLPCVQRLREAVAFRTLVLDTEGQLLAALGDHDTVFINVPDQSQQRAAEQVIKMETALAVKQELEGSSDCGLETHDGDHDYFDTASKSPSSDDWIQGEAELLARFPAGELRPLPTQSSLHKLCPLYARRLDQLRDKIVLPKMIRKLIGAPTCQYKPLRTRYQPPYVSEKAAQITNAAVLIEFSNLTPFKSKSRSGFPCFYCKSICDNLRMLKEHQETHKRTDFRKVLNTYGSEAMVVPVDITDLKCSICNKDIPTLAELKKHLTGQHHKKMHLELSDRVIPYRLGDSNVYECQICGCKFETFGSIERHMNVHYRNYVCKECGTGFITKYRLKVHVKSMHVSGNFPCDQCNKVFTSNQKLKNHVDTVHKLIKRFKCPKCPERFAEYFRRQKHMVSLHGVAPLQYKCNVCDKTFDRRYTLSRHLKRDHLEERDYQCELCTYNCFTNNELRVHMVKHNGERIFECSVCKKSYARKKTLKEHMRIHTNDRRFACPVCGQAFVQKCSLKGHIKTHHLEFNVQV